MSGRFWVCCYNLLYSSFCLCVSVCLFPYFVMSRLLSAVASVIYWVWFMSAIAFIDIFFSFLKTLWGGCAAQADLKEDLYTSAGAIGSAPLMTPPSTILEKHHIIALSSFSNLSFHQSKLPPHCRRLFVAKFFKLINLPKSVDKSIKKSNVKLMPIWHQKCGDSGLVKYVS